MDAARGENTAYDVAAEKAAAAVGKTLSAPQRARWGQAIHWSFGIGAGIVYAASSEQRKATTPAISLAVPTRRIGMCRSTSARFSGSSNQLWLMA